MFAGPRCNDCTLTCLGPIASLWSAQPSHTKCRVWTRGTPAPSLASAWGLPQPARACDAANSPRTRGCSDHFAGPLGRVHTTGVVAVTRTSNSRGIGHLRRVDGGGRGVQRLGASGAILRHPRRVCGRTPIVPLSRGLTLDAFVGSLLVLSTRLRVGGLVVQSLAIVRRQSYQPCRRGGGEGASLARLNPRRHRRWYG